MEIDISIPENIREIPPSQCLHGVSLVCQPNRSHYNPSCFATVQTSWGKLFTEQMWRLLAARAFHSASEKKDLSKSTDHNLKKHTSIAPPSLNIAKVGNLR